MKAYVLIKVKVGEIKEVVKQIRTMNDVEEANMTFGPYDVVAIVVAKDINDISHVVATGIQPIPGVIDTLTCLAVEP